MPQAIHIVKTRETAGVSLPAYTAFALGILLWFVYAVLIGSVPVTVANAITLALVIAMIVLKLHYRQG